MPETESRLRDELDRWTAAGIIDVDQATRIESAEAGAETARRGRLPLVAEIFGYLGAVIAVSAGFVAVRQLFAGDRTTATLAFTGVAALSLIVTGGLLRAQGQPAYKRLRSVLWLLATVVGACFAAILAGQVLGLGDRGVLLTAAAAWAGLAIALWWYSKSALQQVGMFIGLAAVLATGLYQLHPTLTAAGSGTAIWVLSAAWGSAAWVGYVRPRTAGLATGAAGVLIGATITMGNPVGQALGLLTVAALLAIGVATRRALFTGIGAAGALWVVPDAVNRDLPQPVAAPLTAAASGVILLTVALWLARRRKTR